MLQPSPIEAGPSKAARPPGAQITVRYLRRASAVLEVRPLIEWLIIPPRKERRSPLTILTFRTGDPAPESRTNDHSGVVLEWESTDSNPVVAHHDNGTFGQVRREVVEVTQDQFGMLISGQQIA